MGNFSVNMKGQKSKGNSNSDCFFFTKPLVLQLGPAKFTNTRNQKYVGKKFNGFQVGDSDCYVGMKLGKDKTEAAEAVESAKDSGAIAFEAKVLKELKTNHGLPDYVVSLEGTPITTAGGGRFAEMKWPMEGICPKATVVKFWDLADKKLYSIEPQPGYVQAMLTVLSDAGAERNKKAATVIAGSPSEQWAAVSVKVTGVCVYTSSGDVKRAKLMLGTQSIIPIFNPSADFKAQFESSPVIPLEDSWVGGIEGLAEMMGDMGGVPTVKAGQEKKKRAKAAPKKRVRGAAASSSAVADESSVDEDEEEELTPKKKQKKKGGKAAMAKAVALSAAFGSSASESEDEEDA